MIPAPRVPAPLYDFHGDLHTHSNKGLPYHSNRLTLYHYFCPLLTASCHNSLHTVRIHKHLNCSLDETLSPPQIPKISLFWFVKCKKGVWERVVVRPLPTPHIPFLLTLPSVWEEADPEKWVMFPASPVHRGWLWLEAREKPKGPGTPSDREMGEGET